jgi:hypothetical protein
MSSVRRILSVFILATSFAWAAPAYSAQPAPGATADPRPAAAVSLIEQAGRQGPAQAIPLYEKALALSEEALGPDHGALVEILYGVGGAHQVLGEYARAWLFSTRPRHR